MFSKYCPPIVANGKMYVPNFGPVGTTNGSGALVVYGLLATAADGECSQRHHDRGDALPPLTGTVTGLQNGDTLGTTIIVTYSTTATSNSPAGTYAITATVTGSSAKNYQVVVIAGTLTITAPSSATTTTLSAPGSATYGTNVTLTATVTSTAGTPGGSVIF